MKHETYLLRAIELAEEHSRSGKNGPFGAVVVQNGVIVGEGWNQVVENNDPTAHAEVIALRHACQTLKTYILQDCIIYSSSEPCPMCLAAIYWSRINKVYYASDIADAKRAGFDDLAIYQELSLSKNERHIAYHQLLQARGRAVLETWVQNPSKIEY